MCEECSLQTKETKLKKRNKRNKQFAISFWIESRGYVHTPSVSLLSSMTGGTRGATI